MNNTTRLVRSAFISAPLTDTTPAQRADMFDQWADEHDIAAHDAPPTPPAGYEIAYGDSRQQPTKADRDAIGYAGDLTDSCIRALETTLGETRFDYPVEIEVRLAVSKLKSALTHLDGAVKKITSDETGKNM